MLQSLEEVINDPTLLNASRCFIDKVSLSYDFGVLGDTQQDSEDAINLDGELENIRPCICRATSTNTLDYEQDHASGHLPRSCDENIEKLYGWIFNLSRGNSQSVNTLAVANSIRGNRPKPLFTGNLKFEVERDYDSTSGRRVSFDGECNPTRNLNYASDSGTYPSRSERGRQSINLGTDVDTHFSERLEDGEFSLDANDNWLAQDRLRRLNRSQTDLYFSRYIWGLRAAMLQDILRGVERNRSSDTLQLVEDLSSYKVKFKKMEIYWEFMSLSPTLDVERLRPALYSLSNGELRDTDYPVQRPSGEANLWQNQIQNSRSLSIAPNGEHPGHPRIKIYAKTNKRVRVEVEFSPHNTKAGREIEIMGILNIWRERAESFVKDFFNRANAIQANSQSPLLSASVLELMNAINFVTGNIEDSNLVLSLLAENGLITAPQRGPRSEYLKSLLRPLLANQRPQPQEGERGGEPRIAIAVLRRVGREYTPTPHFQRAVDALREQWG